LRFSDAGAKEKTMETISSVVMAAVMGLGLVFVLAMIIGDTLRSRMQSLGLASPKPVVLTPWQRHGVSPEQYAVIEVVEERMVEFPARDVVQEADETLFADELPSLSFEKLRGVVMECRRMRQDVDRHISRCPGCPKCTGEPLSA
jgi:hypothetical protein